MDKLVEIFDRQRKYLESLRTIYYLNGYELHAHAPPWDLQGRDEQEEFRLLAWRFTEELIEAAAEADPQKYITELADALHFLIEIALYAGITVKDVYDGGEGWSWEELFAEAQRAQFHGARKGYGDLCNLSIEHLGNAMCLLKQRPWRTDDRRTDPEAFRTRYRVAFLAFITDCVARGVGAQALYDAFFAKAKVNDQRTREQK